MKLQDVDRNTCEVRARQGASRTRLVELVLRALQSRQLSVTQQTSLEQLKDPTSVVAITGQQVGLFGGPMYTVYKIRSAVEAARLVTQQTGIACLPIFWVEDNDHDAQEAMTSRLLTGTHEITGVSPWDQSEPRRRVADRTIDENTQKIIDQALGRFLGRHAEPTSERIRAAYAQDTSWADAFLDVLAPYLAAWGVLPIRASHIVDAGLHGPILQHLFSRNDELVASIRNASASIIERGGRVQASVPDIPWMYITSDGRQRIDLTTHGARIADLDLSRNELLSMAQSTPERFTPTVLTRPMMQDALLPTVVSVLGAAEMAYHHQLPHAYRLVGLTMPALQLRSGMTLLTPKIARNISKSGHDIAWYRRTWQQIEHDIAAELTTDIFPNKANQQQLAADLFDPYEKAAASIDSTLVATVNAQRAGLISSIEALEGKLRSAAKKKNALTLERAQAIHASIFPDDNLQERVFPLAMWESEFGIDTMLAMCESITTHELGTHVIAQAPSTESHA